MKTCRSIVLVLTAVVAAYARPDPPPGGVPVFSPAAFLNGQVWGLDQTNADASFVDVSGRPFSRVLHVNIRKNATETNATQMTIPIDRAVDKGDVMLASLWVRGAADDQGRAQIEFLFEQSRDPWTKSVAETIHSPKGPSAWKHFTIAFQAAEDNAPGEAMASLRFAFQPQTVEVGGFEVLDYGTSRTLDSLVTYTAEQNPIGSATVSVDFSHLRQTLVGLGGDFCQPRYGETQPMDAVGAYVLAHLHVAHARVGLPLNDWNPQPGVFRDDAQAHATFLALKDFADRKIPTVLTVWEGPTWMLGGNPEQSGRVLDPSQYGSCIDAIVRFLVTARDKYGVSVGWFSFNEPDYGVNFRFTGKTLGDFIRAAGPRFKAAGLGTKFIVGDTTSVAPFHDFALPLLTDPSISEYLGPLGFHSWDGLTATEASYQAIADLGKTYGKPVWCLEAGYDPQLWQAPNPWGTWDNGLETALVYARTLRLAQASVMDYWTYQNNYPIVDAAGVTPYPVFLVIKQMEAVCAPGSDVVSARASDEDLQVLVTAGATPGRFAALLVNPQGAGTVTLRGLPANAVVRIIQSDATAQNRDLGTKSVTAEGTLTISLPTRSVVTLVSPPS